MCEYQPISCGMHEQYQYAVMKRHPLELHWVDSAGKNFKTEGLPVDVFTRSKAEYLRVKIDDHAMIDIRLDRIQAAYWSGRGRLLV